VEGKQINQLMVAMQRYGIKKLALKREGVELELEREGSDVQYVEIPHALPVANPLREDFEKRRAHHGVGGHDVSTREKEEESLPQEKEEEEFILSPMVGTVYHSPSPNDPPYVKPGEKVDEDTVVCLIEAMKVMNEVRAGIKGTIAEITVDDAHPVEFGTKLFKIIPS